MSVLLTCTGKRYDIVSSFVQALRQTGHGGKVIATDRNPLAPAQYAADLRLQTPPVDDVGYLPALMEICADHGVKAVVPLTDLDIELLAGSTDEFAKLGATAFVPGPSVASATYDKYLAHQLFLKLELPSPPTYLPEDVPADMHYPVLVKPRRGSGARSIHRANDEGQMRFFAEYIEEPVMVQRLMEGDEFSIDVLCDTEGHCINAIPRTMFESRGGESIKGATIMDGELIELGRLVGERLPCRGPATVQCFKDPEWGLGITDVNCRFGGAFPAPMYAGGNYPELIVRMAYGEKVEPHLGRYQPGRYFSRYFWHIELVEEDGALSPTGNDFIEGGPPKAH